MDQPGKVANPARGQLNRENDYYPVPVRAWEFGLARRVQPSRPASACSFSILRLNLVLNVIGTQMRDMIKLRTNSIAVDGINKWTMTPSRKAGRIP